MKVAYLDCFSGLSGDITIGMLLDAGLKLADLKRVLARLPVRGYRLTARKILKGSVRCTKFDVHIPHTHHHEHRRARDILSMIRRSALPRLTRDRAQEVFTRLAHIEGKIHGVPAARVEFHEVGAVDAIVDVVGSCAGLELLGIEEVYCSPIPFASGVIHAAHGALPSPGPAAVGLLTGFPMAPVDVTDEIVTPTGAAILSALVRTPGRFPAMTLEAIGYGAGTKEFPGRPNFSRILIGQSAGGAESDLVWVLETNLDDVTGKTLGYAQERLLSAGALDVFTAPIQMKKGRPGVTLSVLAPPERLEALEEIILRETPAFGLRRRPAERRKLAREIRTVRTPFGPVRVKVGYLDGRAIKAEPEYEDARKLAARKGVTLESVIAAAKKSAAAD